MDYTVYKIRNIETRLFKCKRPLGGAKYSFKPIGDIYSTKGIAMSSLSAIMKECPELKLEIVKFKLTEVTQ